MTKKEYKIKGFVARDSCRGDESDLYMGVRKPKPHRDAREYAAIDPLFSTNVTWMDFGEFMAIPSEFFPELKPTDEPIEVEITIKRKKRNYEKMAT